MLGIGGFIGALVILHILVAQTLFGAPAMILNDIRVAARCPDQPAEVLKFVLRDNFKSKAYGLVKLRGQDIAEVACNGERGLPTNINEFLGGVVDALVVPSGSLTGHNTPPVIQQIPTPFIPAPASVTQTEPSANTASKDWLPAKARKSNLPVYPWSEWPHSQYCKIPDINGLMVIEYLESNPDMQSNVSFNFLEPSEPYFLYVEAFPTQPSWNFKTTGFISGGSLYDAVQMSYEEPSRTQVVKLKCGIGDSVPDNMVGKPWGTPEAYGSRGSASLMFSSYGTSWKISVLAESEKGSELTPDNENAVRDFQAINYVKDFLRENCGENSRYLNLGDYFLASSRVDNVTTVEFSDVGKWTFDGQNLSVKEVFQSNGYC